MHLAPQYLLDCTLCLSSGTVQEGQLCRGREQGFKVLGPAGECLALSTSEQASVSLPPTCSSAAQNSGAAAQPCCYEAVPSGATPENPSAEQDSRLGECSSSLDPSQLVLWLSFTLQRSMGDAHVTWRTTACTSHKGPVSKYTQCKTGV